MKRDPLKELLPKREPANLLFEKLERPNEELPNAEERLAKLDSAWAVETDEPVLRGEIIAEPRDAKFVEGPPVLMFGDVPPRAADDPPKEFQLPGLPEFRRTAFELPKLRGAPDPAAPEFPKPCQFPSATAGRPK